MNEQQRDELRQIRAEQELLKTKLARLEMRLARLDAAPADEASERSDAASVGPSPETSVSTAPLPIPPPASLPPEPPRPPLWSPLPPSLPSVPVTLPGESKTGPPFPPLPPEPEMQPLPTATRQATAPSASEIPASAAPESLEMRIGTTWLARAGVVLLLTSLAFFGNYLYHNIVPHLGPMAKVGLLYLGAGALAGAGAWLERSRQAQESPKLRNYARVVLAGGLAAVYYVTYAAHYFENLRVIDSRLLAGALLLGWSGFIVWLSDRRSSETLATLAILLGFYTSAINESVGAFTLFSNLALSGGAVFLLRRHLWKIFPFASLLASFGSYAFWTYFRFYLHWHGFDGPPQAATGGAGFWVVSSFLLVYWLLFTWAAFTSDERVLPTLRRAGFVSLNNGALFLLVMWRLYWAYPGTFWEWALLFGAVLLALAETCRRLPRPLDANTENAYLLQGVLLVTLGFINYFSGWQLSLMLAVQSVTLLAASGRRQNRLLLGASAVSAVLSFGWATHQLLLPGEPVPWSSSLGVGAFLVFAAWLAQRALERPEPTVVGTASPPPTPYRTALAPMPGFYAFLGLAVWWGRIEQSQLNAPALIVVFSGAAVALTASVYVLRVRSIPFGAQAFLVAGFVHWAARTGFALWPPSMPPTGTTLALLAAVLASGHWFRQLPGAWWTAGRNERAVSWLDAVLAVVLMYLWVRCGTGAGGRTYALWTAELAGLSLLVLGYGIATRYRALAVVGQGLLAASVGYFLLLQGGDTLENRAEPFLALAPLVVILLTLAADRYMGQMEGRRPAPKGFRILYEVVAVVLFLVWGADYVPLARLFALDSVAGGAVATWGILKSERRTILWGGVLLAAALVIFGLRYNAEFHRSWLNLLGIAAIAATQQFGRRRLNGEETARLLPPAAQATLISAAVLCAWAMVTAWTRVFQEDGGFATVVGWSLFAPCVLAAGWFLREKVYRWLGLVILGAALAHVVVFDIWQLDSLGRTISLFCLGLVVLGIGYLYNRFHAKFRQIF